MRMTERRMRQIIQEEVKNVLNFDVNTGKPITRKGLVMAVSRMLTGEGSNDEKFDQLLGSLLVKQLMSPAGAEIIGNLHTALQQAGQMPKSEEGGTGTGKGKESDDPNRGVRDDYRQRVLQGISQGRQDWSNFPGPK
jgi:hypothetical protein